MNQHANRAGQPPFGMIAIGSLPVGAVTAFAGVLGQPNPATAAPPDSAAPPVAADGSPPSGSYVTTPIEAWGWMLCDGRSLAVGLYPELFAVLGYLYGGSGANFNIPDYRGTFLRGTDYGAGVDPDTGIRTAPGGGSYDGVGSLQTSAMLVHEHKYQAPTMPVTPSQTGDPSSGTPGDGITSAIVNYQNQTLSTSNGLSNTETRPCNTYVNYLIKFTYGKWQAAGSDVWPA